MDVAGVVVYVKPDSEEAVGRALAAMPGVEVHAHAPGHRFVITVEDVPGRPVAETLTRVSNLDGVLVAATVYDYSDSTEAEA